MNVGQKIKQLREKRGLSQERLGVLINVSKQNIYKYETGIVTNIPSDKVESLARIFNVTPAYLMGWDSSQVTDDQLAEWDTKYNTNGKLAKETKTCELIEECHGADAVDAVGLYVQLDDNDRAEIRGEMKHMLKAEKYAAENE